MKTFTLPVSDCGMFVAGEIGPDVFTDDRGMGPVPKHGVIIWYESKEACKEAFANVCGAHWPDDERTDAQTSALPETAK
jgi:hypothetical protein